jgi:hypothetical protein
VIGPTSARERRLVALLILMMAIAILWFAILAPVINGFAERAERREQLSLRYVHNLRTIGSVPRLRRQAEEQRAAISNFVTGARSVEEGREWLKDRLQKAIEQSGGEFREAVDVDARPHWARARASARMTLPQLTAALGRLQNAPPWLIVESLSISASDVLVTGQSSSMDVQVEASIPLPASAR